jgi:hypothetical protein
MINTLTYEQAVVKCPAITATGPSNKASAKYNFISTGDIVRKALDNDWVIREARGGKGIHGIHSINLIHKSQINTDYTEGFPQINLINSHNLARKFSLALGFFRLVCSNGLIAPTGLCQSIMTFHRNGSLGSGSDIVEHLNTSFSQFDKITNVSANMKQRNLSDEERGMLARYAYYIRFRYRMSQPKKVDFEQILKPRREVDAKSDLWSTFNVIQENITHGGTGIGRGINRFEDDLRFNQELWTGMDTALRYEGNELQVALKNLFPKKERPRKTSK